MLLSSGWAISLNSTFSAAALLFTEDLINQCKYIDFDTLRRSTYSLG
jgi:hypothetical protein